MCLITKDQLLLSTFQNVPANKLLKNHKISLTTTHCSVKKLKNHFTMYIPESMTYDLISPKEINLIHKIESCKRKEDMQVE